MSRYVPSDVDSSDSDVAKDRTPPVTRGKMANVAAMCGSMASSTGLEPNNVREALACRERLQWREAMESEIKSIIHNQVWTRVDRPPGVKPIGCRWIFKVKHDKDGKAIRYKARLVAKGFSQRPGIDYKETYAPVMRLSSLKLLLALAVEKDLSIDYADIQCAYLHGDLKETVYMEQPEGFSSGNSDQVCLLKKALYGLKQAGRAWYQKLTDALLPMGFKSSDIEPCVFTLKKGNSLVIVAIWVDDCVFFSNDQNLKTKIKTELGTKFAMRDLGEPEHLLGIRLKRDGNSLKLDQANYISNLLGKFDMSNCKPVSTPMEINLKLEPTSPGEEVQVPYQELVGSLTWLSTCTRPDIAFATNRLASYNNAPSEAHWKALKRILRYLKGTLNVCLTFQKTGNCHLTGFTDSDWGGSCTDRKSCTGWVFTMAGAAISWESRKQRSVALSTCEAEYMSMPDASKEVSFLNSLLEAVIGSQPPIILHTDNWPKIRCLLDGVSTLTSSITLYVNASRIDSSS